MCLACETDLECRWELVEVISHGRMPEGHTADESARDGAATAGRSLPRGQPDGTVLIKQRSPSDIAANPSSATRPIDDRAHLTLAEARDGLRKKIFRSRTTQAHVHAIEAARALNAFVLETPERRREMAKASDARIAKGEARPLEGIPLAIKDLFCTEGVRTTACSHILDNFMPTYEFTVTAQLWRDGAVMLGKTNNDEFAMGSSNETSYFGPVHSTRGARKGSNTPLTPGGSSGGSAAAVAAQSVPRRDRHRHRRLDPPAGGLHRHRRHQADLRPLLALGHRRVRVLARSGRAVCARPCATPRSCCARWRGPMPKDTTCADLPVPDYEAAVGRSVKGLRIGIPKEYRLDGMPAEIEALWERRARVAEGRRRRNRRRVAAAHQIRAAGLLHRRAGRGLVESRAL